MKKGILALTVGAALVAACGLHFAGNGVSANAESVVPQETANPMESQVFWEIPDFCPECGAENSQTNMTCTYFERKDGCTYTYRHAVRSGNYCTGEVIVHNGKEFASSATCTEDGEKGIACADCGAIGETASIPAQGHVWSDWIDERTSCEEGGKRSHICLMCGAVETQTVSQGTHVWKTTKLKEPTCTEDGEETVVCIFCGREGHYTLDATGHQEMTLPRVEPTCDESGLTEGIRCSDCEEDIVAQETISALGHDYKVVYNLYPEGNVHGEQLYQCSRCGDVYGKAISPEAVPEGDSDAWGPALVIVEGVVLLLTLAAVVVLLCKVTTKKKD